MDTNGHNEETTDDSLNLDDILQLCLMLKRAKQNLNEHDTRNIGGGKCGSRTNKNFNQKKFWRNRFGPQNFPNQCPPFHPPFPPPPPPWMQHQLYAMHMNMNQMAPMHPQMPMHSFMQNPYFRPRPYSQPQMSTFDDCNNDSDEEIANFADFIESAKSKRERFKSKSDGFNQYSEMNNKESFCDKNLASSNNLGNPSTSRFNWKSNEGEDDCNDELISFMLKSKRRKDAFVEREDSIKGCKRCSHIDDSILNLCRGFGKTGPPGIKKRMKQQLMKLLLEEFEQNNSSSSQNKNESVMNLLTESLNKHKQQNEKPSDIHQYELKKNNDIFKEEPLDMKI